MNNTAEKTISQKAYGKYQMNWMMSHGYSLYDVFDAIKEAIDENNRYDTDDDVFSYIRNYFDDQGFGGELFVCFEEFMDNEYKDIEFIYDLLSKEEFFEYLKSEGYEAFERFYVDDYGVVTVAESNYMTDGSVTDNPNETSRIVECSGAAFNLNELTGDEDIDTGIIDFVFSNCKEYIEDVTDEYLLDHIYDWFSKNGIRVGDYYNKNLKTGEYIKIL